MSDDQNRMADGVHVALGDEDVVDDRLSNLDPLPKRPADSARREEWVSYVVALGADGDFVNNETEHANDHGEVESLPSLTVPDLKDLADRLGG